jgi:hypothetical protein
MVQGLPIISVPVKTKKHLMKHIYTLLAFVVISLSAVAAPSYTTIKLKSDSWWVNWSNPSVWDLNRVPKNGDSVVIPAGLGVVFDVANSYNNMYVNIIGTMSVMKTMTLNPQSVVSVATGGRLYRFGASPTTEIIVLGGKKKFDENSNSNIFGFNVANSNTGISPAGFSNSIGTLPVLFKSFYAVKNSNSVVLNWSTAQEFNNNNFEIQRSMDGVNWNVISIVMGAGTSYTEKQYSYTDKTAGTAVVYYRIRQVDIDGKYTYSTVKTIRSNETAPVTKVYASGKNVNVEFNSAVNSNVTVRVLNTNGQVVTQQNYQQPSYKVTLNTNANTGVYVVQVTDGKEWSEVTKVML